MSNDNDWKNASIGGILKISLPIEATCSWNEDTLYIALPTIPESEIIIGRFLFPENKRICSGENDVQMLLKDFIDRCIMKHESLKVEEINLKSFENGAGNIVGEGTVKLVDGMSWFVRIYTLINAHKFYLVHWRGTNQYFDKMVKPAFDSLEIDSRVFKSMDQA